MKKVFLFGAALFAAVTVSAQAVTKQLDELVNYVDFQKVHEAGLTATAPTSTAPVVLANGTKVCGYLKASDNTEAVASWNTKDKYNTTIPTPKIEGIDSITVGSMARLGSGCHIDLGAFITTGGKLQVYFQPNADSERGVKITNTKTNAEVEVTEDGKKLGKMRPGYVAEFELGAGSYAAGDIVITLVTNTSNIFGINIEGLYTTGLNENVASSGIIFNGSELINANNVNMMVYNVLGKMVANTTNNLDMSNMPNGVYVVRVAGMKGALKIQK